MLVYLGDDLVVDAREVVAILDLRRQVTAETRDGRRGSVARRGAPGVARTQVVTTRGTYQTVVSPTTAVRRLVRATAAWRARRRKPASDAGLRR